ncbi:hypothetical protein RUM44_011482 [Polyplax serrata]|uniref:Uncharacterized protein n=1 Tax=Polyplax serrata TaxID=468196 RepID=A0ABR1AQ60_POLSC
MEITTGREVQVRHFHQPAKKESRCNLFKSFECPRRDKVLYMKKDIISLASGLLRFDLILLQEQLSSMQKVSEQICEGAQSVDESRDERGLTSFSPKKWIKTDVESVGKHFISRGLTLKTSNKLKIYFVGFRSCDWKEKKYRLPT